MRKLSKTIRGRTTSLYVFTGVFIIFSVYVSMKFHPVPLWNLLAPGIFLVVMVFQYFAFGRHIVDEVNDTGNALVFKKGNREQTVALADIEDIEVQNFATETGVTVYCRNAGEIGSKLMFVMSRGNSFFSSPPELADLVSRIESAKTG